MFNQCSVCEKRILSHSPILKCDICPNVYHISCLPFVSKRDSIYAERNNKSWMCISCAESTFPFNRYKEEYEFYDAVSHLRHSFPKELSFESFHDQIFNPFESDEFTSVLLLIMLILIFISLMTHCRGIYLRIQIINLRILLMSYIAK